MYIYIIYIDTCNMCVYIYSLQLNCALQTRPGQGNSLFPGSQQRSSPRRLSAQWHAIDDQQCGWSPEALAYQDGDSENLESQDLVSCKSPAQQDVDGS